MILTVLTINKICIIRFVTSNFRRHKIKSYKSYLKTKIDLDSPNWDEREVFMSQENHDKNNSAKVFNIVKRFFPENDKTTNYIIEWTLYLIAAYNSEFDDNLIKDNKYTNFQKFPDKFNLKIERIEEVPHLKPIDTFKLLKVFYN